MHLYKLFSSNPHFQVQQTLHLALKVLRAMSFETGQRCHYNVLAGPFSASTTALNNENAFTEQIHSLLKQWGNVQRQ